MRDERNPERPGRRRPLPEESPAENAPPETAAPRRRLLSRGGVSPREREMLTRAGEAEAGEVGGLRRELDGLRRLLTVSRQISSILDPDPLFGAILDAAIDLTGAERGLLLREEDGQLRVLLGRGSRQDSLDPRTSRVSETLARECLRENRVIPHADLAGLRGARSIAELSLFAAVCVPLRDRGEPFGVLYLDSATGALRTAPQELELLEGFASQAAISLLNARRLRSLEESRRLLSRENLELRRAAASVHGLEQIVGQGPSMVDLRRRVLQLAGLEVAVLILGESGTGKDLVARALHSEGERREAPFVAVNCAGLPNDLLESSMFGYRRGAFTGAYQDSPGLVEQADSGTLFLDEIGDMPLPLQAKLLRFLENGEFRRVGENQVRTVRARVLSATHRTLPRMIEEGSFRRDLYYRLAGVTLELPPLRERTEDLPVLVDHILGEFRRAGSRAPAGITDAGLAFLRRHPWPGNIRELRHALEAVAAFLPEGGIIDEPQLRDQMQPVRPEAPALAAGAPLQVSRNQVERAALLAALGEHEWNVTRAARSLGISRQHLHNRIRLHGLSRPARP